MPFPLLFTALGVIAGILAADTLFLSLPITTGVMIACLACAWTAFAAKRNRISFALVLATSLFFGAAYTLVREKDYEENSLRRFAVEDYADFTGILARSPAHTLDRDILLVEVKSVLAGGKESRRKGRLQVSIPRTPESPEGPSLATGDEIKVSARILPPRDASNFNPPFSVHFLKSRNIHNRAFAKSPLLVEKIRSGGDGNFLRPISRLRQSLQNRLENLFPAPKPAGISAEGAVMEALLLGDDGRLPPETVEALQKTGLYHLFAISGAHVAVVTFLLFSLFRLFRIPKRPSYAILIAGLVFYALLVEGRPSVLRAILMTLTYLVGRLLWKDVHLLNTLSLSALILLLANPFSLFDLGFQLTFAATLAIILIAPRLIRAFPNLPLKASELAAVSIAASLGVFPLVIHDFNRVAFSSILLNFAAVPLVGFIMIAGYVFLPLSFILPFLGKPMAFILEEAVKLFSLLCRLLDPVPFLSYRIPTPPDAVVIAAYASLLLMLLPRRFKGQKRITAAAFALAFLVLVTYPFPQKSSSGLKVTVLDVGQGDSILVEFPGRRKMLIDGGGTPTGSFDIGERIVSPFLWRKGIKKIDILVLTHAHPDHLNGLKAVARNFRIGEFWEADKPSGNDSHERLRANLGPEIMSREVRRGFTRTLDGVTIEALHPAQGEGPAGNIVENDRSLVLKLSRGGLSFLLPGDIGRAAENEILASVSDIRCRVLKAPHHGSATSSSAEFLARVSPEIVIITVGKANRYGFPQKQVLDRYAGVGARVFRTDFDGAVEISEAGGAPRVRTSVGARADRQGLPGD